MSEMLCLNGKRGGLAQWLILGVALVAFFAYYVFQNSRGSYNGPITMIKNSCFLGGRVLSGAVEMYNIHHASAPMTVLDIPRLEKEGFLRTPLRGCDPDCSFKADLTGPDPVSWCVKHGNDASPTLLTREIFAEEMSLSNRVKVRVKRAFPGIAW